MQKLLPCFCQALSGRVERKSLGTYAKGGFRVCGSDFLRGRMRCGWMDRAKKMLRGYRIV